ncbi:MAG TPA: 3D domain-containing protein [Dehalococcoidia bacterium]|nr:3D domain-containing protein [Dehalococcoidia bacterium]
MPRYLALALVAGFLLLSLSLGGRDRVAVAAEPLALGSYVTVDRTQGYALKLRDQPTSEGAVLHHLPGRTILRVLEGPTIDRHGWEWYRITGFDTAGSQGWSVGYFLSPYQTPVFQIPRTSPRPPFRVLAHVTAYNGAEYGNPYGGRTRLGTLVRPGVVATDPAYIPLGTELMIEGVDGVFVSEDTGSGVFGYHVDVYFPSVQAAWSFGSRWTYITVLGRPYERTQQE